MNFSENIRNGLTNVAAGLTNFGHSLENMQKRNHDWNEESKALGLVSDDEKLKLLKAQLFRSASAGKVGDMGEIQRITCAIDALEEIKARELKHRYSLPVQLEIFTNTTIMLLITLVAGSFLVSHQCGDYQSQFCSNARVIPTQITRFYYNYFFK